MLLIIQSKYRSRIQIIFRASKRKIQIDQLKFST